LRQLWFSPVWQGRLMRLLAIGLIGMGVALSRRRNSPSKKTKEQAEE
jgi:hypothetical protein